jgi:hypothetical protein
VLRLAHRKLLHEHTHTHTHADRVRDGAGNTIARRHLLSFTYTHIHQHTQHTHTHIHTHARRSCARWCRKHESRGGVSVVHVCTDGVGALRRVCKFCRSFCVWVLSFVLCLGYVSSPLLLYAHVCTDGVGALRGGVVCRFVVAVFFICCAPLLSLHSDHNH